MIKNHNFYTKIYIKYFNIGYKIKNQGMIIFAG
jgi:hypothetical protein